MLLCSLNFGKKMFKKGIAIPNLPIKRCEVCVYANPVKFECNPGFRGFRHASNAYSYEEPFPE